MCTHARDQRNNNRICVDYFRPMRKVKTYEWFFSSSNTEMIFIHFFFGIQEAKTQKNPSESNKTPIKFSLYFVSLLTPRTKMLKRISWWKILLEKELRNSGVCVSRKQNIQNLAACELLECYRTLTLRGQITTAVMSCLSLTNYFWCVIAILALQT